MSGKPITEAAENIAPKTPIADPNNAEISDSDSDSDCQYATPPDTAPPSARSSAIFPPNVLNTALKEDGLAVKRQLFPEENQEKGSREKQQGVDGALQGEELDEGQGDNGVLKGGDVAQQDGVVLQGGDEESQRQDAEKPPIDLQNPEAAVPLGRRGEQPGENLEQQGGDGVVPQGQNVAEGEELDEGQGDNGVPQGGDAAQPVGGSAPQGRSWVRIALYCAAASTAFTIAVIAIHHQRPSIIKDCLSFCGKWLNKGFERLKSFGEDRSR